MGDNVVDFNGITKLDLDPDRVIQKAKDEGLEGVIVLGYTSDGEEYFASSYADGGTVNWLLDRCKQKLLMVDESDVP